MDCACAHANFYNSIKISGDYRNYAFQCDFKSDTIDQTSFAMESILCCQIHPEDAFFKFTPPGDQYPLLESA
jgi:hypothetical protein